MTKSLLEDSKGKVKTRKSGPVRRRSPKRFEGTSPEGGTERVATVLEEVMVLTRRR